MNPNSADEVIRADVDDNVIPDANGRHPNTDRDAVVQGIKDKFGEAWYHPIDISVLCGVFADLGWTAENLGFSEYARDETKFNDLYIKWDKQSGRLVSLTLWAKRPHLYWRLSPEVVKLEGLTQLTLWKCSISGLLPVELSSIKNLKHLILDLCEKLVFPNTDFPNIQSLTVDPRVSWTWCWAENARRAITWATKYLTNVVSLTLYVTPVQDFGEVVQLFNANVGPEASGIYKSLKLLSFRTSQLDEFDLEETLFQILPIFPNLTELDFSYTEITTLSEISQRLRDKDAAKMAWTSKLQRLCLDDQAPVQKILQGDKEEVEAIVSMMRAFPCLSFFTSPSHDLDIDKLPGEVKRLCIQNRAGRVLIESKEGEPPAKSIPLSVWPLVLTRARRLTHAPETCSGSLAVQKTRKAAGMAAFYYLLRNSAALARRQDTYDQTKKECPGQANPKAEPPTKKSKPAPKDT